MEYDTELSHFTLVIIPVSAEHAEELAFCMFFRILIVFTYVINKGLSDFTDKRNCSLQSLSLSQ